MLEADAGNVRPGLGTAEKIMIIVPLVLFLIILIIGLVIRK